jgi:hypothetical protein
VLGAVLVWVIVLAATMIVGDTCDLCLVLGASITGSADMWSWLLGAFGQLLVGAMAGVVYAAVFEWATRRAGALVGFIVGLAHVTVAGIATGFLPAERLFAASLQPPGAFFEYRGLVALIAFIIAHLAFGVSVGAMYGRVRHAVTNPRLVWRDVTRPS